MKKFLFIIILVLSMVSLFAGQTATVTTLCNVRAAPNSKAEVVTNAYPGMSFGIKDVYGPYYKVEVTDGSKNVGRIGWMWVGVLEFDDDKENATVGKTGVTLRKEPKKGDNVICFVINGAKVEILDVRATWYNIGAGWVYKKCLTIKGK